MSDRNMRRFSLRCLLIFAAAEDCLRLFLNDHSAEYPHDRGYLATDVACSVGTGPFLLRFKAAASF
jgi:hypothetical protein